MQSPAAPTNCRVATRFPTATPSPLVIAAAVIILAAKDEVTPVKPIAPGTGTIARAPAVTAPASCLIVGR